MKTKNLFLPALCICASAAVAHAGITLNSQTDNASVTGFVAATGAPFGAYNQSPANNVLLGAVNYSLTDTAVSGDSFVTSDMTNVIDGTAFGSTGLLVTGSSLGHVRSVSVGANNTSVGSFQAYQLNFTLDVPTPVYLRVEIVGSSPVTAGSIGLLSNPVSIGWGAGPGLYVFNDVLAPGSYTLNANTNLFYSTGGTTDEYSSSMNFRFELGEVPAPGAAALLGIGGLAAFRRRR